MRRTEMILGLVGAALLIVAIIIIAALLFNQTKTPPTITINPISGPVGTQILVQGRGWEANRAILIGLAEPGEAPDTATTYGSATASSNGTFTFQLTFPNDQRLVQRVVVQVVAYTAGLEQVASAVFTVTNQQITPAITIAPSSGTVGTIITVNGTSWAAGSQLFISLALPGGTPSAQSYAQVSASPDGTFSLAFSFPNETPWIDAAQVHIIAHDDIYRQQAEALFRVLNATPPVSTGTVFPSFTSAPGPGPGAITATPRPGGGTPIPSGGTPGSGPGIPQVTATPGPPSFTPVLPTNTAAPPTTTPPPTLPAVPPTATASSTPTPAPSNTPTPATGWRGENYNNINLSGAPVTVLFSPNVNFDWGAGSPAPQVPADNFSVRWTGNFDLGGGRYRFYMRADDGGRLWVDGNLIIDQWHDSAPTTYTADVTLAAGNHQMRLEYYEHTGTALINVYWDFLAAYPDWKGEYFNNPDLLGSPVLMRNDQTIDFNWGGASSGTGVPADAFSVRWTRQQYFSLGPYRFTVRVDDGARLFIDDRLVIDQWHTGAATLYDGYAYLTDGNHAIRLEYFDAAGNSQISLNWQLMTDFPNWKGEYFNNRDQAGTPYFVRDDPATNFNWGGGSPGNGLPADNFSVRWTRLLFFDSGAYRFTATVDDGVRVWMDSAPVINEWHNSNGQTYSGNITLNAGTHQVQVDYYENTLSAFINASYALIAANPTATTTRVPPPTATATPTMTPRPPTPTATATVITRTPIPTATNIPGVPTATPYGGTPRIHVDVSQSPIFVVSGTNWPANTQVTIGIAQARFLDEVQVLSLAAVDENGTFSKTLTWTPFIPTGQGWLIVAYIPETSYRAITPFNLVPPPQ